MTSTPSFDIVLRNGRVMDPETGFDEICDVAIRGDAIAAIGPDLPAGATEIESPKLPRAKGELAAGMKRHFDNTIGDKHGGNAVAVET